jgi:hypothetical protein
MAILRQFEKFGSALKKGLSKGVRAVDKGINVAGRFVVNKVLPTVVNKVLPIAQKVAGVVSTVAKFAAPVLLASGVGAEFAPLALGVAAGAGAAEKGIGTVRKGIQVGKDIKKGIQVAGEVTKAIQPSIEKGMKVGGRLIKQL